MKSVWTCFILLCKYHPKLTSSKQHTFLFYRFSSMGQELEHGLAGSTLAIPRWHLDCDLIKGKMDKELASKSLHGSGRNHYHVGIRLMVTFFFKTSQGKKVGLFVIVLHTSRHLYPTLVITRKSQFPLPGEESMDTMMHSEGRMKICTPTECPICRLE